MISVLIPVFNQSVVDLASQLSLQLRDLNQEGEIIILDDGSDAKWKSKNKTIATVPRCQYEELPQNVGRSIIRNLLAAKARGKYLLFLDGDSKIYKEGFLEVYFAALQDDLVIVGGRKFPEKCPNPRKKLHWRSGWYREQKIKSGFQSNNFLIPKKLFHQVGGFDESLKGYGHEDTLFGYDLDQCGIRVTHIDNPTLHAELKNGDEFLSDQEKAIINLHRIVTSRSRLETSLTRAVKQIKKLRLGKLLHFVHKLGARPIRKLLIGPLPNLILLDIYKIGYYIHVSQSDQS